MSDLGRLSINQATVQRASLPDLVDACAAAGVPAVGLWREPVQQLGIERAAALLRDAGLRVSSLCRGGFFPALGASERARRVDDNRRALDEAAALGTDTLVLVSGGLPDGSTDLDGARQMVVDGIGELVDDARRLGVRLAIEPLHPMFCSDRCVVVTLGQALDIAEQFPADAVGVLVDTYHVWWDPAVHREIARAAGRICSFQVGDWVTPLPAGVLVGRGLMGDGCIDLGRLAADVAAAGYRGDIEVEIFNEAVWALPAAEAIERVATSYATRLCC